VEKGEWFAKFHREQRPKKGDSKNCHQASVSIAKVIHVFDREGDIAEVFESASEWDF
jgi:hypothetical protein